MSDLASLADTLRRLAPPAPHWASGSQGSLVAIAYGLDGLALLEDGVSVAYPLWTVRPTKYGLIVSMTLPLRAYWRRSSLTSRPVQQVAA